MVGKNCVVPTTFSGIISLPACICTMSPIENSGLLIAGNGNGPVGTNKPRSSPFKSENQENVSPDSSLSDGVWNVFKLSGVCVVFGNNFHCCMLLNSGIEVWNSLIVSSPEIRLLI